MLRVWTVRRPQPLTPAVQGLTSRGGLMVIWKELTGGQIHPLNIRDEVELVSVDFGLQSKVNCEWSRQEAA